MHRNSDYLGANCIYARTSTRRSDLRAYTTIATTLEFIVRGGGWILWMKLVGYSKEICQLLNACHVVPIGQYMMQHFDTTQHRMCNVDGWEREKTSIIWILEISNCTWLNCDDITRAEKHCAATYGMYVRRISSPLWLFKLCKQCLPNTKLTEKEISPCGDLVALAYNN